MTVVAHAGHWLNSLIYIAPVLLIAGGLFWSSRKDRREQRPPIDDDPGQRPEAS